MSYIGKIPATGNFVKLDAISVVNGQASYTMQSGSVNFTPESANHMLVSLNGVIQAPITSFSVSGSTITFASALSTGDVINFIMVYGNVLDIGTPSDDTISASKLQTDSVIEAKIQNDAVTRDKINAISTSSLPSFEAKGTSGQTDGYIQLNCEQNSHGIKLKSPPHSAGQSYTLTFPSTAPANDKFLQTNSSGVLSFADAGGGLVLLQETNVTTTTLSVEFTDATTGVFDGTYRSHIILITRLNPEVADRILTCQLRNASNGTYLTSSYAYVTKAFDTGGADRSDYNTNGSDIRLLGGGNGMGDGSGEYGCSCIIYCNDFTDSTTPASIFGNGVYSKESGYNACNYFSGTYRDTATTIDGIRFKFHSDQIDHGCFTIYGVKK
jgi:hypothetical protein